MPVDPTAPLSISVPSVLASVVPVSTMSASPVVASPVVAAPVVTSPVVAAPVVASPVIASPVVASPVVASPVVASPPLSAHEQLPTTPEPPQQLTAPKPPQQPTAPKPPQKAPTPKSPQQLTAPKTPQQLTEPKPLRSSPAPDPTQESTAPKPPQQSTMPKLQQLITAPKTQQQLIAPKIPQQLIAPKSAQQLIAPKTPQQSTSQQPISAKTPQQSTSPKPPQQSTASKTPQQSTLPNPPQQLTAPKTPSQKTTPKTSLQLTAPKTLRPSTAPDQTQESTPRKPLKLAIAPLNTKHTVHWFRKGLRLHDNPSLREGLLGSSTFRCVFIIDPWFAGSSNVGINKWRFLLQCLEDLDWSLRKLKSRLFVVRGQPADVLPKLFREWGTTALSFEEDPEPYGRVRDRNIISKCREVGISITSSVSHTLYNLENIIECNGGRAPLTYHKFQALIASMPSPKPAEPVIKSLHGATTPIGEDHEERFGVPSLDELGFVVDGLKAPVWIGGESEALSRLDKHLERKAWVASFGRPKMTTQSLFASQTGLSPYLRFGCLSTRLFYYKLTELYERIKGTRPPLSLHGQLLWREFFYCAATRNPNFDRMEGNPICVQIPWDHNQDALAKWANGQTGFPWIDAVMIQLREEGWIHHLARHAVACFLTRGDLWISWEEGMKVFDELLLDADWSVNAGMWMWLSCSSFFQQFFHCYSPVRFGRKVDPNGDFIRKYIPALKNMPSRYIHEPWKAPEAIQQSANCRVGQDYPLPMVDHAKASQTNIERIRQVYAKLAKYKPQGGFNPQPVPRPNEMHSPSPTAILTSINQSNYLCPQSSDRLPYKDEGAFQRPMNTLPKRPHYKHIVIVQQTEKTVTTENTQRVHRLSGKQREENYDFKNLNINSDNNGSKT